MNKLKTISLKGKEYVTVDTRVEYFNQAYPTGKIETTPTFQDEKTVYFKAVITPMIEKPERIFTGHSFGILGQEKALEKLETVAVGRALAFMGIGIVEGIASADEMAKFQNSQTHQITFEQKVELAKAGRLSCAECKQPIFYEEYKTGPNAGQPKDPKCQNWKHKGYIVKPINKQDKPF